MVLHSTPSHFLIFFFWQCFRFHVHVIAILYVKRNVTWHCSKYSISQGGSDKDLKPKKKGSIFSFFKKTGRKRNPYGDDFIHVEPKHEDQRSDSSEQEERISDLHGDQAGRNKHSAIILAQNIETDFCYKSRTFLLCSKCELKFLPSLVTWDGTRLNKFIIFF